MKIFIIYAVPNIVDTVDEIGEDLNTICKALRYHYSNDNDSEDASIEISCIDDNFEPRNDMLYKVCKAFMDVDVIALIPGYEKSEFLKTAKSVAEACFIGKLIDANIFSVIMKRYKAKNLGAVVEEVESIKADRDDEDSKECEADKEPKKIFISGALNKHTKRELEYALSQHLELSSDDVKYIYSTPIDEDTTDEKLKKTKNMISQIKESELVVYFPFYNHLTPERAIANMCGCKILTEKETEEIMSKYPMPDHNITVGELIEKLKEFDKDLPVVLNEGPISFLKDITEDDCYDRTRSSNCVLLSTSAKEK